MKFCSVCNNLIKKEFCLVCKNSNTIFVKTESNLKIGKKSSTTITENLSKQTVSFDCPICKHNRATYEVIQTRALDEAPTEFYTCENCNHCKRI